MKGTAIVVGASSGIGAALARRLAREDRRVVVLARREAELRSTADEINRELGRDLVLPLVHDASDLEEAEVMLHLAHCELDAGHVSSAGDWLAQVAQHAPTLASSDVDARLATLQGAAATAGGDDARAQRLLAHALAISAESNQPLHAADAHRWLGRMLSGPFRQYNGLASDTWRCIQIRHPPYVHATRRHCFEARSRRYPEKRPGDLS